jgi:myo-inositol-1(or 4)-monophosphatase
VPRPDAVLPALHEAAKAVAGALAGLSDWGPSDDRRGHYKSDLVADEAAVSVLTGAGFGVFSEESGGHHLDRPIVVSLDPIDGSTNAWRGLPWWATSLCAVDSEGPLAAVVVNQATGERFEATRGGGAQRDGKAISPTSCTEVDEAIVAVSGYPADRLGWSQFRALGAAALDMCAVACGQLDAFVDWSFDALAPWDYLGGLLVCLEAGAAVVEPFGLDLGVHKDERRTIVAAATPELAEAARINRLTGPAPA